MQPKLNDIIYVKYHEGITKEKVIALGKDIFIHTGCIDPYKIDDYKKPLTYKEYGITWFTNLKEVKQKYKIKQTFKDYWEVVE